jgi:hypothetical protein
MNYMEEKSDHGFIICECCIDDYVLYLAFANGYTANGRIASGLFLDLSREAFGNVWSLMEDALERKLLAPT